jgi:hypothetical protein
VTIHYKYSNPARTRNYPLAQARDLFPTLIAYHIHMTSGSTETDPRLSWAIDHWRSVTTADTTMSDNDNRVVPGLRGPVQYQTVTFCNVGF